MEFHKNKNFEGPKQVTNTLLTMKKIDISELKEAFQPTI